MTDTLTVPETVECDIDEPHLAHIVKSDAVTDAYVFGTPIEALCGLVFVPSRDPERYPKCEECIERMKELILSGKA